MMPNLTTSLPRVVITMGEPAGIGPELLVKLAQHSFPAQIIAIADPDLLSSISSKLEITLKLKPINWQAKAEPHMPNQLWIEPVQCEEEVVTGSLSAANAETTLNILNRASELALSKQVDAIVTAPVHKANLNQKDNSFLGHTEYFAKRANVAQVVMMLATDLLRMTLATTHLPLADVPNAIQPESLKNTMSIILNSLSNLIESQPKLAVCGLNPHAGEDGLLGKEEVNVIKPVIEQLKNEGYWVDGPFPADTLFTPEKRAFYDVFLAMYHDQGLPVIKTVGFGECANVTLGLPYIRTSVDHGTALDIAAQFKASEKSLVYAVNYAIEMTNGRLPS